MISQPKVFGLMPTMTSREKFAERAIRFWNAQDYAGEKRLVIDARDAPTVSAKLNAMVATYVNVKDAVFIQWDDDDYHGPSRVRRQVEALLLNPQCDVCGLKPALFYHQVKREVKSFITRPFDATIAFRRSYWDREPWEDSPDPSGPALRLARQPRQKVMTISGDLDYVWIRHGQNYSIDPPTTDARWQASEVTADEIERLLVG